MARSRYALLALVPALLLGACTPDSGGGPQTGRWPVSVSDGRVWRSSLPWPPGFTPMPGFERNNRVWVRGTVGQSPLYVASVMRKAPTEARNMQAYQRCGSNQCPVRPGDLPPLQIAIATPERMAESATLFRNAFELFQRGEFVSAAQGFERGLRLGADQSNAVANFYFAETLVRLGLYRRAALHYSLVPHLAPNTPEALQAEQRLRSLGREQNGRLTDAAMANIEEHIIHYAVTDILNSDQRCGFPSGRQFFVNDLMMFNIPGDQVQRLTQAFDRMARTWTWRSTCNAYGSNALNPENGNSAIPRMQDLIASGSLLSLLYVETTDLHPSFRDELRSTGVIGPRE